jgi:cell division protein FtsW (lipid II flippase)
MGSIICYGVACFISLHLFVNLGGVFGLIPLTGVPLPFLSYGGTFALIITISLGVVQRICYESKISEQYKSLENNIKER